MHWALVDYSSQHMVTSTHLSHFETGLQLICKRRAQTMRTLRVDRDLLDDMPNNRFLPHLRTSHTR